MQGEKGISQDDVIQLLQRQHHEESSRIPAIPSLSLLEFLQKASNPLHASVLYKLKTVSQNRKHGKFQIIV